MNDPKSSKNYVVSKGPVNRRTAQKGPEPPSKESALVKVRVQLAKARQRLGVPLSQRLTAEQSNSRHSKKLSFASVFQAIGGTVSAIGLMLALIQSSVLMATLCAALVCGFAAWAYYSANAMHEDNGRGILEISNLIDICDIEQLDRTMEKLAAQEGQATVDRLALLKESMTRCIALMTSTQSDGSISTEDHLYIRECVRRYVPDSINACLQIPQKDRASLLIDGSKSALDLLHEQIDMIQSQLKIKENHLTQLAGEGLLRQHRFLAAKTTAKY
jgi:hypothetical protein